MGVKTNIREAAEIFRDAIENIKYDLPVRDRMSGFPHGCCDDATDLFATYLYKEFRLKSIRVDGAFYNSFKGYEERHTWLEIEEIIIDLTADQFKEYTQIYIGPYDKFHRKYDLVKIPNYRGISDLSDNCHSRMEEIYERIVDEIER